MSKVVDITGVSSKEARLKRIIASLEEIKDTLVDVIDAYEAEDESSDKLDLLTEETFCKKMAEYLSGDLFRVVHLVSLDYIDKYEDEADKYIKFILENIKEEENVFKSI